MLLKSLKQSCSSNEDPILKPLISSLPPILTNVLEILERCLTFIVTTRFASKLLSWEKVGGGVMEVGDTHARVHCI